MQDVDQWLDGLIEQVAGEQMEVPELKRAIREKLLESYRNGQQAGGQSPAPERPPKSRNESKQPPRTGRKQSRYAGNWTCSKCGGEITSLPFEPRGTTALQCIKCYKGGEAEGTQR